MDNPANQTLRNEIYLLLANLFRQPPNQPLHQFLTELECEAGDGPMQQAWHQLREAAAEHTPEQIEDEYQELFIGIGRGEVVPFASWHLTGSLMEKPLAAVRQDLARLGLEREEQVKEPEDHIAALCEVMSLISSEDKQIQQQFFNRHIGSWYEKLATQIEQAEHASFYRAVANLCRAFCGYEQVSFSQNKYGQPIKTKIDVKNVTQYEQSQ
ncbi:TorD/DmsD family molecular chaperone [Vibrio sp.]|uniref:TorD/DmsD family molecular chaperone n=1 Tax=Vibrio sp. TaxID=678 RepID=UPI003D0DA5B4